jgi:hypothetical protein
MELEKKREMLEKRQIILESMAKQTQRQNEWRKEMIIKNKPQIFVRESKTLKADNSVYMKDF